MIDEDHDHTNPYATFDGRTRRFEETNAAAKLLIEEEAAARLSKTQRLREMRLAASKGRQFGSDDRTGLLSGYMDLGRHCKSANVQKDEPWLLRDFPTTNTIIRAQALAYGDTDRINKVY
ncbi:hypothetical protein JNB91_27490 [Rhizobium wenxiniae]|uniref:hypothetical protein n=1 Tax=Rhizobium wenxiniae TaxID=1737357 RepID=UPI001C6E62EE|nr:hypothetical protein [Rhizobium wenxiniae]MBW9091548.1 hypothetical protein [Rhizobium wenxiniae]